MVENTISRLNVLISAQDRASATINRVQGRLSLLSKEGLAMGAAFAAMNYGIGLLSSAVQNLGNFLEESTNKFYEFNRAITEVATMLDKTETKYIPELEDGINRISVAFGQSAVDTTRALYQALSAGISVTDSLKFMWEASKLAKTGLASLETTVDVLTTVLNAYGMSANQVGRISDIMMATVVKGKLRLEDLATSLGYVVPVAAQAGVSFEEVSAAMATMTKQGINTQIAARGLRQLITNLIAPSESAKSAMVELGVSYDELTLRARGLKGVIELINEATGGSVSKTNELIPNVRALSAELALSADNGNLFGDSLEYIEKSFGIVNEKFKEVTKSAAYQRDVLKAAMEAQQRAIGEMWQPISLGIEQWKLGMIKGGWLSFLPIPGVQLLGQKAMMDTYKEIAQAGQEAMKGFETETQKKNVEDFVTVLERLKHTAEENDVTVGRLKEQLKILPEEIEELTNQLSRMQEARNYQLALRYIPFALKSAAYASRIFDERVRALVDSIRIQRNEIDKLRQASELYSLQQTKNNLEMMKIELAASYRRGRLTREEKARLEELKRENLKLRISETENQIKMDEIKQGGLSKEEQRLEQIKMEYQDRLFTIMDTYEQDVKKLQKTIQIKENLLNTHQEDLKIALKKSQEAWQSYYTHLLIDTAWWSEEMKKYFAEVAGYTIGEGISFAKTHVVSTKSAATTTTKKTEVKVSPITVNANIKTDMDVHRMGSFIGQLIATGIIKGVESEMQIG